MKALGEAISLWMVPTWQSYTTLQWLAQGLPEYAGKPRVAVTNNFFRHTKAANPVFEKELGSILGSQVTITWDESYQTGKTIHNTKNSIISTCRDRQVHDKIHGHMLKTLIRILKRLQKPTWLLSTAFVLLANCTMLDKLIHRMIHILPIKSWLHLC